MKKLLSLLLFLLIMVSPQIEAQDIAVSNKKDPVFKNGFFIDGGLCYAYYVYIQYHYNSLTPEPLFLGHDGEWISTLGVRFKLGYKWNFGGNEKYRAGFQILGPNYTVALNYQWPQAMADLSPLNLGFTNTIKLKKDRCLEVNLNIGPAIIVYDLIGAGISAGVVFNPVVKYRIGKLTIGLDLSYRSVKMGTWSSPYTHQIQKDWLHYFTAGVTIGGKF
ncbi:MAG: hypothetical protein GY810_02020 [Aureispira sp.]|nr:hypothetical protein [Aureispira sp.]